MRPLDDLPYALRPVDRIMQRWAVSIGSGLPQEVWDDTPQSKPPPLDDDMAVKVDRIVVKAHPRTYRLLWQWYRTPLPRGAIARMLNIRRGDLNLELTSALTYLRVQFMKAAIPLDARE